MKVPPLNMCNGVKTGLEGAPKGICKDRTNGTRKAWNMETFNS